MKKINYKGYKLLKKEEEKITNKGEQILETIKNSINDFDIHDIELKKGSLRLIHNLGGFLYSDGEIIQNLKSDSTHLDYYNQRIQRHIDSSTYTKSWTNTKNKFKTDLIELYVSLITGEKVYGYKNSEEYVIDYNNKPIEYCARKSNTRNTSYLIGNSVVKEEDICAKKYYYGRRNKQCGYYSCEELSEAANSYIDEVMSKYEEVTGKTPRTLKRIFYIEDNFYININVGNKARTFRLPTKRFENIIYAVIENQIYYIDMNDSNDYVKKQDINTEYSMELDKYFVLLQGEEAIFSDKPISKYLRIYKGGNGNYVVSKDYCYNLEDIKYEVIDKRDIRCESITVTEILIENDDIVYYKDIFLINRDTELLLYFKANTNKTCLNGLERFKNLKCERKSTDYYILDNILYKDSGDYHSKLDLANYNIKSIKVLHTNNFYIEDINKNKFISDGSDIIPLLIDVKNIDIIHSTSKVMIVIDSKSETQTIQINNRKFELIKDKLYLEGEHISDNVKFDENECQLIITNDNVLGELTPEYRIKMNGLFTAYLYKNVIYDDYKTFTKSIVYGDYVVHTLKDDICTEIDFNIYHEINSDENSECIRLPQASNSSDVNSKRYLKKISKTIIYGWTVEDSIVNRYLRSGIIWAAITKTDKLKNCKNKEDFYATLHNSIINTVLLNLQQYGIIISENKIEELFNDIDFIDFATSIENIHRRCDEQGNFKPLQIELNKYLNNLSIKNEYIDTINRKNIDKFEEYCIDIDKFNTFDFEENFIAEATRVFNYKNSIQETLIQQIKNLIGSREKNISGVLQIFDIDSLKYIYEKMFNKYMPELEGLSELEKNNIIKLMKPRGFKLFKILKSYQVKINYAKAEIYFNDTIFTDTRYEKIIKFTKHIISFIDETIEEARNSDIQLIEKIIDMLNWCRNHINEELMTIENLNDSDLKDIQSKKISIKLWDRNNLFRNLAQGSRTHCCIALDSYNIQELVDYILNKNMVLVEIIDTEKNKVVGQGFVYMAASQKKINYNYKIKKHCFMIVDNVEINKVYQSYSMDIAYHFQNFMRQYSNFMGDISDVFLGTNYNDIPSPYGFKQELDVSILGNVLYRDSPKSFYKFI